MRLHQPLGARDADGDNARTRVFLEALAERAALAAVEGQHGGIDRDTGESLVDDAARNAGCLRLAPHGGKEGLEIAVALGGESRAGEEERGKNQSEKSDHETDLSCPPADPYTVMARLVPRHCHAVRTFRCHARARARPSTSLMILRFNQDVDARHRAGHDVESFRKHSRVR